jgi:hypothetical protein
VLGGLNSDRLPVLGYALAALFALWAGAREARRAGRDAAPWPAFWFVAAALLAAMAVGRASDLGRVVSELGRREAVSEGWYDRRREVQELAIVAIAGLGAVVGVVALWRTAVRRSHHLPMVAVLLGLGCFATIRMVSLHDVDAVLHRYAVAGVQLGTAVELGGIAVAIATTIWLTLGVALPRTTATGPDPGAPTTVSRL